jgi:hypothetical protein
MNPAIMHLFKVHIKIHIGQWIMPDSLLCNVLYYYVCKHGSDNAVKSEAKVLAFWSVLLTFSS